MKNNKAITLIALIITIIVLLILAGVSIATLTGENGLLNRAQEAKDENEKALLKEEIELTIMEIQMEETINKNNVTLETLADGPNEEPGQLARKLQGLTATYENNQITGEYEGYLFEIDSNFKVTILDKLSGIIFKYTLSTQEYTNKDIILTLNLTSTDGTITKIESISNLTKNEDGTYTITANGNYEFKIEDSTGATKTGIVKVQNIDKLAPLDFTPSIAENSITEDGFTIIAEAQDATDESGISVQSEIARYEYYVGDTKYDTNIITGLDPSTEYSIYVVAYDNANNDKTSATITQKTKAGTKNIYIDSVNGNDTTGDGTQTNPLASFDKIIETGYIKQNTKYNIYLQDGIYNFPSEYNMIQLNCNESINIYGNKEKTILELPYEGIGSNSGRGGTTDYSLNFYKMVMQLTSCDSGRGNYWCCSNNVTFYNVIFNRGKNTNAAWSFILSPKAEYINCISVGETIYIRCDVVNTYLTNCYGNFASGYNTTDVKWNYKTNYKTTTPKIDTTTYRIIDSENVWKNVGTGTDPDGSQADLGVYGGEYSWEN